MSEVSCHTCKGACCSALIKIELDDEEFRTLVSAGTVLEKIEGTAKRVIKLGCAVTEVTEFNVYRFKSDCGRLTTPVGSTVRLCSLHGDDKRPSACGKFPAGEENCLTIRLAHQVDSFDEFMENHRTLTALRLNNAAASQAGTTAVPGA